MIQRCEDFGFSLKPREPVGIVSERRRKDLDGDLTLESSIGGPVHLSHSTRAQRRNDVVGAKARSGRHRHCLVAGPQHPLLAARLRGPQRPAPLAALRRF